jgi:hypothetical protein
VAVHAGEGAFMKKSFFNVSLSRLFLLLFFLIEAELFSIAPSNQAGTATVNVFPSSVTASVSQNFSINVNVTGVSDLYGWEFKLNWTATILNAVNVTEGPFLESGGNTFFYSGLNATEGHVTVECTLEGNIQGVSGNGVLATITFNVKSSGQSPLNLYYAVLLNSQEQTIPSQQSGGIVYCLSSPDVAVTSVSVSPITVLPGTPVHVNATVQNLGGFAETFNVTTYANSYIIGKQKVALNSGSLQTLYFTWDTTGYSKGDYNVSAVASTVPGETNTTNNVKAATNIVTILYNGHDIAVTSVNPGKTVIGQGYSTIIKVTVKNYGTYPETFNTTAYYNTTALPKQKVTLQSGASTTINFTWNTAGFAYGNYTISANVMLTLGETNQWIGPFTDGTVKVTIPGDANGDGVVNISDIGVIAAHWLQMVPPGPSNADVNCDGIINILDVGVVATHWLQTLP